MIEDAEESLSMEIEDDDDDAAEATPPANKRSASSKETEKKKRELISIGKAKGFLTYDEINDSLSADVTTGAFWSKEAASRRIHRDRHPVDSQRDFGNRRET